MIWCGDREIPRTLLDLQGLAALAAEPLIELQQLLVDAVGHVREVVPLFGLAVVGILLAEFMGLTSSG